MGPIAAVREFFRMASAAGNGLERAGRDIREYNASHAAAEAAGAQAAADVRAGHVRESLTHLAELDANTQARMANTEALERLTRRLP